MPASNSSKGFKKRLEVFPPRLEIIFQAIEAPWKWLEAIR
jgi:hypothetical protein